MTEMAVNVRNARGSTISNSLLRFMFDILHHARPGFLVFRKCVFGRFLCGGLEVVARLESTGIDFVSVGRGVFFT